MRIILLLLVIGGLIIGFMPRPLFTPDWRTPYEAALEANDCDGLQRLFGILSVTNDLPGQLEVMNTLEKREICGATRDPATDYELHSTDGERPPTFLQRAKYSSLLYPRIEGRLRNQPKSQNPIIHSSQIRFRETFYSCAGLFGPFTGHPDYTLMAYALEHSEMSVDDIAFISLQQTAACAGKMLEESVLMLNVAKTPEDYEISLHSAALYEAYGFLVPATAAELVRVVNALPDEVKDANGWAVMIIIERRPLYIQSTIGCSHYSERLLAAAEACASRAANLISEIPDAALFAHYYALRAKRLGWVNITSAEEMAQSALTPECLAAVTALEENHAADRMDTRQYDALTSAYDLHDAPACAYLLADKVD